MDQPQEMGTFTQPKVTGYRQLNQVEADLMNEVKLMAVKVGELVERLQSHPGVRGAPLHARKEPFAGSIPAGLPPLDQRWVAEGKTDLQKGFMSLVRAIAQPTTF